MNIYMDSHIGRVRKNNEDSSKVVEISKNINLLIVADGMGGHKKGEIASSLAIEYICKYVQENKTYITNYIMASEKNESYRARVLEELKKAMSYANGIVAHLSSQEAYKMMGTTVVMAIIYKNMLFIANVGDSRCYHFSKSKNGKELCLVTKDNSLVQELLDLGEITMEEAEVHPQKNVITRAIGIDQGVKVDTYLRDLSKGDLILLCSDGLTGMVSDEEIEKILKGSSDIKSKGKSLIEEALNNGGRDNITIICAEIDEV